jgi:hypothetical protein
MRAWRSDELEAIDAAQELTLASSRRDGTLRCPVTMWVVRSGDEVFVRSVNGRESSWFRGAQDHYRARIEAGELSQNVVLAETDERAEEIDAAYQTKYGRRYPTTVPSIVAPEARAATLKLTPDQKEPE